MGLKRTLNVLGGFYEIGGISLVSRRVYAKLRNLVSTPYGDSEWATITHNGQPYYMNTEYPPSNRLLLYDLHVAEPQVTTILDDYLSPGDVAVDIGAQCGDLSFYLHSLVGSSGEVHCFEPVDEWFTILNENIDKNSIENIYANSQAVSKRDGESDPDEVIGGGHDTITEFEEKTNAVSTTTLEEYFSGRSRDPDLVKIDVDGMELDVLRGMESYLGEIPVVLELHATNLLDEWQETIEYVDARTEVTYLGAQRLQNADHPYQSSIDVRELSSSDVHYVLLE